MNWGMTMKMLFAKDNSNGLALSTVKATAPRASEPQDVAVVPRLAPKGPFKVLTIPKSWSDSLHTAQAKAARSMNDAAGRSLPAVEETLSKWKQHILTAKSTWSRLTDDELLKCDGQVGKLVALIQKRYAIVRGEAHRQVAAFFEKRTR
jgi:uncharacterized protein YjbJ (UPF0337 family)